MDGAPDLQGAPQRRLKGKPEMTFAPRPQGPTPAPPGPGQAGLSDTTRGKGKRLGGGGGIRTRVPGYPDHLISSQRRYGHFGTPPEEQPGPGETGPGADALQGG